MVTVRNLLRRVNLCAGLTTLLGESLPIRFGKLLDMIFYRSLLPAGVELLNRQDREDSQTENVVSPFDEACSRPLLY